MFNEAIRCLDEGVSGSPGPDAAGQIDLGSVMGLGFPAFRGGILWYGEQLTAQNVFQTLSELSALSPARLTPAEGLVARAKQKKSFFAAL